MTMPRQRPAPEPNIIQNPRVLRGLQQFTGTRQAHIAPAMTEGIAPSVIVGDIREDPRTGMPESFAALHESVPDGVNVKRNTFHNPYTSERIAVLRRLHIYIAEDMHGVLPPTSIVYDLQSTGATVMSPLTTGQRLVTGYQSVAAGAPSQPISGLDISFPPRNSVMGWKVTDINGIAGGYIWRGVITGTEHGVSGLSGEVNEEFMGYHGPRMIVFPGGNFEFYALSNALHSYANMWWDEYPLT